MKMQLWLGRTAGFVLWSTLLISTVPWRQGVYYEGGLDVVVVAKAALQGGVLVALLLWNRVGERLSVPGAPVLLLSLFVAVSLLGAWHSGDPAPSGVLAVRLLLAAVTVMLVLRVLPEREALGTLLAAMGAVGLAVAAGGLEGLFAGGRLEGGLLPLSPNLLALLAAAPALACIHLVLRGRGLWWAVPGALLLGATVIATGSRTGIAVLALSILINVLYLGSIKRILAILFLGALVLAVAAAFMTPMLSTFLQRSDSASLVTLNSRTIAWNAVLSAPPGTWSWWVGDGLSVKTVAVEGQYWDEQVLDSSWISALAQAGIIGTAVLLVLVVVAAGQAFANRGVPGGLPPALMTFVLGRSLLENGLTEASPAFLLFFLLTLIVGRKTQPVGGPAGSGTAGPGRRSSPAPDPGHPSRAGLSDDAGAPAGGPPHRSSKSVALVKAPK